MMTSPTIVVLEDELAQMLAVRAALRGLGEIREFTDPNGALGFLRQHTVDVAVVDIHMPQFEFDGMALIRTVRSFDHDLCVIIRTGDDSSNLADDAIEVRAFRRAIKGRTSVDELRSLAAAAVMETRSRRQISADAAQAAKAKAQLARTLGEVEEVHAVSDTYRDLFQGMQNRLTALAGTAEVISEATIAGRVELLKEHAPNNKRLVCGLLAEINAFLDSPFAHSLHALADGNGTVARVLTALERHFRSSPRWSIDQKNVAMAGLDEDMAICASPLNLVTAIRHLMEYCLERSSSGSTTRVSATFVESPSDALAAIGERKLVFTERPVNDSSPCVAFCVSAPIDTSLERIRGAFDEFPDDPRSGNLQMIPLALRGDLAALAVHSPAPGVFAFDLFVPIAR